MSSIQPADDASAAGVATGKQERRQEVEEQAGQQDQQDQHEGPEQESSPPPPPQQPSPSPPPPPSPSSNSSSSPSLLPDRPASPELPLTMTASTVLLHLPRDATAALAQAGAFARDKVVVRFKPVGSAPPLAASSGGGGGGGGGEVRRKITSTQKFEVVVAFVRRALRVRASESVFLYVNSSFAPALDEVVGNLHRCFKDANDQLNVSYSLTPAFG